MTENNNTNEAFNYTYSAKQQSEIANIRKKYMPAEEDKMELLRKLDRSVTTKGTVISLIVGILGALILGVGMCCCLVWMGFWFVPGIIIGIIGIAVVSVAYPIYLKVTKAERERIAPEIIKLSDELMK